MAKLYFRYGVMGSSKTANALMVAFNYEERGQKVLLAKPRIDQRDGDHLIKSRTGMDRKCLYFDEVLALSHTDICQLNCLIVDEAQFLTADDVRFLTQVVDGFKVPVICYGLRTDFQGNLFPGSAALLAAADTIEEIKTICWCGRKATCNARFDANGDVVKAGEQVVLGANDQYTGLCRTHWKLGDIGAGLRAELKKKGTSEANAEVEAICSFSGDYHFLSNFYSAPVEVTGLTYLNNEAAFQAQKTLDHLARLPFTTMNPSEAKKAGRKLSLRTDWESVKVDIMHAICFGKFVQNDDLRLKLLATGTVELIEGNTWGDHEWGVDGYGKNKLGYILMRVRSELAKQKEKQSIGTFQETMGKRRGTAVEIIEVFEDLLERHGISVPDDDRTGAEGEAPIYGVTYGDLEDRITLILADHIDE